MQKVKQVSLIMQKETHLKGAIGVDTSNLEAKSCLTGLKIEEDKKDIGNPITAHAD